MSSKAPGLRTVTLTLSILALLLVGRIPQVYAQADSNERPNIIFVFTDDHASHAISAYGSRINQTPNIDRLAEEGMIFRNAFVTNSICAPSRAAIQTGKFGHLNGVPENGVEFDNTQQTFPKLLQEAGYQTAIVGKWHLQSQPTGFDYWEVLPGQGDYYNPEFRTADGRTQYTGYVTDIITDRTLNWLQNGRSDDEPFMLMYQHKAPHRNWQPGPEHLDLYDDAPIPEPKTLLDDYDHRTSAAKDQKMEIDEHMQKGWDLKLSGGQGWDRIVNQTNEEQLTALQNAYADENSVFSSLAGDELVRWKYQRYIKDYLRTIASVDDNLGRVLDYLEQSGLDENTIVIYSSDQGFFLGDHGWFDKRWMYEESFKTPLIVRWPGVTDPGSENTDLVQNLDFAQTFLDMAGVDAPDDMQGRSLVPLLEGQTPADWRASVYYQYWEYPRPHAVRPHYGVRTQRYKLIHYPGIDEWELFDLQKDPDELNSIYDNPTYQDEVERLKQELQELRDKYDVPEDAPVAR